MRLLIKLIISSVLLASMSVAQAAVDIKPSNFLVTTSQTHTIADVTAPTINDGTAVGAFAGGAGSVSITVDGLSGYTTAGAQGAISDFATYLSGLAAESVQGKVTSWIVVSSGDADATRLNNGEALVYTFNTSGLTTGDLSLQEYKINNGSIAEKVDVFLYDPVDNEIDAVAWEVTATSAFHSFSNAITDGAQFIMAPSTSATTALRVSNLKLGITLPTSDDVVPPSMLMPVVSNSLVQLDWLDDPSPAVLDGYTLYRSDASNGTFFVIASDLTVSAYNDFGVTNDFTYYYKATAVKTGGAESGFGSMVSATPAIPVPTGFLATAGNTEVSLNWDESIDYLFDSFTVYRSATTGTNYTEVASGITTNVYVDTNVVNETRYYYVVSHRDSHGDESAFSVEADALPSRDLVVVNLNNNRQGSVRAVTNGATYAETGTTQVLGNMRVGQFGSAIPYLSRGVLKFELEEQDVIEAGKTADDIERVSLRMYVMGNSLTSSPLNGSVVEVFASQDKGVNSGISVSEFEEATFSKIGDWAVLTNGAPGGAWYDIDVTAAVLNDLTNDTAGVSAGSVFRLQLNGDTSLTNANYLESIGVTNYTSRSVNFADNLDQEFAPQLRVHFKDNRPGFVQWADLWLPKDVSVETNDFDADGLNNLYEYGLDGDPTDGTQESATLPAFIAAEGGGFTYLHPKRSDDPSLVYTVQTKTDLLFGSWTNIGYTVGGTNDGAGFFDTVTNSIPTDEDQLFIKLIIEN